MRHIRKRMRRVASVMALLSFVWMLGAVGDMELGIAGMLESVVRIAIRLTVFGAFVYLAGGFEDSEERWNKRKADV